MADVRNETAWNSQVSRTELTSGEPIAAGSRFVMVNRGEAFDATISTFERPGVLEVRATGSIELVIRYAFAAHDGGTQMPRRTTSDRTAP